MSRPDSASLAGVMKRNCGETRTALSISRSASAWASLFSSARSKTASRTSTSASDGGRRYAFRAIERATFFAAARASLPGAGGSPNRRFCTSLDASARSSTSLAIARYCSDWSGESVFKYPSPNTSSGSSRATPGSTPKRSRSVLPYSILFSRRITNAPGFFELRNLSLPIPSMNFFRSSSVGCLSTSSGGMSWAFTFASACFQRLPDAGSPGSLSAGSKLIPPFCFLIPWQLEQ